MSKQHILVVCLGFSMGLVSSACVTTLDPDTSHCRNAAGDQTCVARYGEALPYCTSSACDRYSKDGCVAERPSDDCYYPCGSDDDVTVDDSCMIADDGDDDTLTSGDGDSTNGDGDGDVGGAACMGPSDCTDDAAPFCDVGAGLCVGCGSVEDPDSACAGFDAQLPVCAENVCVACTQAKPDMCGETTPICDPQSHACVGCSDHYQCPESACNLAAGSCLDPTNTLHVDGDNPDCDTADGSEETPYCKLGDALFNAAPQALIIFHELEDEVLYSEANEVTKTIALFAADGERPSLTKSDGKAPLSVAPSGILFARGVRISGVTNKGLGLVVNGGQAWVEQCMIVDNKGGGILVDDGGALTLENSFVGGDNSNVAALDVIDGNVSVVFSTLAAGSDDAHALLCVDGSGVSVRNSILVSRTNDEHEIICINSQVVDSFIESNSGLDFDADWFLDFGDGDFHLTADMYPTEISTAASWQTGDPSTDIDGDQRPTGEAMINFAGADRP